MQVETEVADSSASESQESSFDIEAASNDLASEMFPEHEQDEPNATEATTEIDPAPEDGAAVDQQQAKPEVEPRPAPKTWPKEMHDHWGKTPKEVQDYWDVREKQMLDGIEQYRHDAGFAKEVKDVLTPYMATINSLGISAPAAIKTLLNADHLLRVGSPSQKAQYFQSLAKEYGVDLGQSMQQSDQSASDPRIVALQDELHSMKQVIQSSNQQQLDAERNKIQNEVNSFASDPKHPYFDEVSDEIVALLKNGATLEDAYEKAVWANPVTRQKEMSRIQTENEKSLKERAIAEAAAKKKAAEASIRSRDSQRTPTGPQAKMTDLGSALQESMREIKSRH